LWCSLEKWKTKKKEKETVAYYSFLNKKKKRRILILQIKNLHILIKFEFRFGLLFFIYLFIFCWIVSLGNFTKLIVCHAYIAEFSYKQRTRAIIPQCIMSVKGGTGMFVCFQWRGNISTHFDCCLKWRSIFEKLMIKYKTNNHL
jgi:hypothetical protein